MFLSTISLFSKDVYELLSFFPIFFHILDAIGVVHELASHHIYSSPKRVLFTMKDLRYNNYFYLFIILDVLSIRFTKLKFLFDHSGQNIICTLWDDLCLQWLII